MTPRIVIVSFLALWGLLIAPQVFRPAAAQTQKAATPVTKPLPFRIDDAFQGYLEGKTLDLKQPAQVPRTWRLVSVVPDERHAWMWFQDSDGTVYMLGAQIVQGGPRGRDVIIDPVATRIR